MSKNELARIDGSTYLALTDTQAMQEMVEAQQANADAGGGGGESVFLRIKTPSGGTTNWDVDGVPSPDVTGILVGMFKRGVLWPSDDVAEGTLPALRTDDLRVAYPVGEMPDEMADALEPYRLAGGTYDWQRLAGEGSPYGWGSGKGGNGKLAKEQRVLFILREGDLLPVLVTVGPGSLKQIKPLLNSLTRASLPYYRAIVSLTLEKAKSAGGTTYSRIVFNHVGEIGKDAGRLIYENYTKKLAESLAAMNADNAE